MKLPDDMRMDFGNCIVCGQGLADKMPMPGHPFHEECATCPKCGVFDLVVWRFTKRPFIYRCLNCLERWETA
jgi:hypothetical protein